MTPATLNRLATAAQVWLGTPFFPHGTTPGPDGGCSCQTLSAQLYIAAGVLPEGFDIPIGALETGFEKIQSALDTTLSKYFERAEGMPQAGDLMLFQQDRAGHLGVCLGDMFIHCRRRRGTRMSKITDATYMKLLKGVWRPRC
jgi:cell wall-associated NlpC family hydrolase